MDDPAEALNRAATALLRQNDSAVRAVGMAMQRYLSGDVATLDNALGLRRGPGERTFLRACWNVCSWGNSVAKL
jgi:hypothetical protein